MRILVVIVALMFLVAGIDGSAIAQDKKSEKAKKENVASQKPGKPVNTICPVTDEEADGEIVAVHKGVTYALCCKRCLKKFEKDPEKYIKKLNQTK